MCRKPVESTGKVFVAFFPLLTQFTANNLKIKRRRKEELSKKLQSCRVNMIFQIRNSKQRAK